MKLDTEDLTPDEIAYLDSVLVDGELPTIEELLRLIDAAWEAHGCDQRVMDERVARFYADPVWLLNGLFAEQDPQSVAHRQEFTLYVASGMPKRVADFGGGYGGLARMIGVAAPGAEVHVVEPHPRPSALALAEKTPNVRYVPELSGEYDTIVATDVFEHVPDPLALVEKSARFLRDGGEYLIANCFWPAIRCHLPETFHFRLSWDACMAAMNLQPREIVAYGRVYVRAGAVSATAARKLEAESRAAFARLSH